MDKLPPPLNPDACGNFEPKNILLTGGAGFIGSHVAIRLVKNYPQYKVIVFDKLDYCASLRNLGPVENYPNFKFVRGDIQSLDLLSFVLKTEEIDTVMHFAAQSHVDNSFGNSLSFTLNNVYGTHVLLEACRMAGGAIRRFLNVSTDEVYGESSFGGEANHEGSTLQPTNPYSAAKAGAEMLVKAYYNSYKLPCLTTRGNNVYGPHQYPEKAIPKFVLLAQRGQPLPIHGSGENTRSYLYVEDVAEAFDTVLHRGKVGETYNIGTQLERTVNSVAGDICKLFGRDPRAAAQNVKDRCFNDRRYFINDEKLAALGWKERTDWEDGLQRTVKWYMDVNPNEYWEYGDVEVALRPHPTVRTT